MDNQHRKITGYRELDEKEIAAMNEIKQVGEDVSALVARVKAIPGIDARWAAIATTDLQTGFMALVRSVAQPDTF